MHFFGNCFKITLNKMLYKMKVLSLHRGSERDIKRTELSLLLLLFVIINSHKDIELNILLLSPKESETLSFAFLFFFFSSEI